MGTGFLVQRGGSGGSGGGFGLQVVSNPRPKNPVEGVVWVNTDVDITGYFLSAEQPENFAEGNLWIKISDSSNIKVGTPLGKDYITIMLNSVSQYVGGAWKSVEAQSFQNGVWSFWWNGELLDGSNQFEAITGGWIQDKNLNISGYPNNGTATFDDDGITLSNAPGTTSAIVRTKNKIKLSDYSTLTVNAKSIAASNNISIRVYIITGISGDIDTMRVAWLENITSTTFEDYTLPLNLDGEYYIALAISAGQSGAVKKMRLS